MDQLTLTRNLIVVLSLGICATSCSVTPPGQINELYQDVIEQRQDDYQIKEGDILAIRLYNPQQVELNQESVLVLPDGKTDLFFMHDSRVAGMTVSELEAEMRGRISTEVRDPEITIQVTRHDELAYLYGDFERPQVVELTTRMTLQQAIASVGGLRVTGDTDWALLRRPYRDPYHPDRFRIDLNDESEELFLLPGDQIYVGKNAFGTIVHYIQVFITSIFPNPYSMLYATGTF